MVGATARRAGVALLALCATSLGAQARGVETTLRTGIAVPSDDSQSNCGHSSIAFGFDVQGRRAIFPQFSFDHFSGSGGGDVLCLVAGPNGGTATGGLRLEGATRGASASAHA